MKSIGYDLCSHSLLSPVCNNWCFTHLKMYYEFFGPTPSHTQHPPGYVHVMLIDVSCIHLLINNVSTSPWTTQPTTPGIGNLWLKLHPAVHWLVNARSAFWLDGSVAARVSTLEAARSAHLSPWLVQSKYTNKLCEWCTLRNSVISQSMDQPTCTSYNWMCLACNIANM